MFEKVNPAHPDKLADRIAGAIVDLAYKKAKDPRIAVEVLVGHGECHIIAETSVPLPPFGIAAIVERIAGKLDVTYNEVPQDTLLARNQSRMRCGDNGIFKGVPLTVEQDKLTAIAHTLYDKFGSDGKYILDGEKLIEAHKNPDLYPDLVVRVTGFTAYFASLSPEFRQLVVDRFFH